MVEAGRGGCGGRVILRWASTSCRLKCNTPIQFMRQKPCLNVEKWASMALFLANAYARGSLRARPKRCSDKAQFTESNNPAPLRMCITIPSDKSEGSSSSSDFRFFIRRPASVLTLIPHPSKSMLELWSCKEYWNFGTKNSIRKLHGNCD